MGRATAEILQFIKRQLSTSPVLALFDPERETIVSSDASSYGLGAVLKQKQHNGEVRPNKHIHITLLDRQRTTICSAGKRSFGANMGV